jgi:hypothetical protein
MLNVKEFQLTISKHLKLYSNRTNKPCRIRHLLIMANTVTRGIVIKESFWKTLFPQEWNCKLPHLQEVYRALAINLHLTWTRLNNQWIKTIKSQMYTILQLKRSNKLRVLVEGQDLDLRIYKTPETIKIVFKLLNWMIPGLWIHPLYRMMRLHQLVEIHKSNQI